VKRQRTTAGILEITVDVEGEWRMEAGDKEALLALRFEVRRSTRPIDSRAQSFPGFVCEV
jgi:hypothetical protein